MTLDQLWQGFCVPPDEARPRVWWHWMDGNVDPAGIRLDLEWLHRVGVRGVQLFNGGTGTPLVVPERVLHGSLEWRDAVRLAAATAHQLGLEFTVATSPGWSAAGGPWVAPADAMKKVVWSETAVDGGTAVDVRLAPLPDVAGPYQDCVRWGADRAAHQFAQDWVTLAVPAEGLSQALSPAAFRSSTLVDDYTPLIDGGFASWVSLPRDPDGSSTAWIEQVFDEPVTVAAATVGLSGPSGFGAAPPASAVLEADDGTGYRVVTELGSAQDRGHKPVPVCTVAFAPVTASRFRLVLRGESAAAALPRLSEGVRLPPILRSVAEFFVSQFTLFSGGRINQVEQKAGFATSLDYYALDTDPASTASGIDPTRVVDLTGRLGADGSLRWSAPPGQWRVLRFGASLTGQTNGPATPEATGLEVDKLDAARVSGYLDTYLGIFEDVAQELDALLSDSIESGPQNFTERLRERFTELRGYDPLPWLPTLAGYVVGDVDRADRFLWDYRRTIADLIEAQYYGTLETQAHTRGLTYYAEALEDQRPQLGDDLAMRSHADVPMGAMWLFDPGTGHSAPTYLADVKGASSVAHVYGKPFTGAESMSAFHRPWSYTPRRLKHIADLELALGVTRFCLHTSPHQPTTVAPPGISLAPFLGQVFVRSEPWADLAGPWIDYLARCSWLLNQGLPAVDIAVFIGEEAPVTALFGTSVDRTVPAGFDFDYVNLDALERRFTVDDGDLIAGETRYRLLYLGGSSSRMTVRALRRLIALVEAGATVVGRRPAGSPSLADDQLEHARLCDAIWGHRAVLDTEDLTGALACVGLHPQVVVEGPDLLRIGRRFDGAEVVFLANPLPEPVVATVWHAAGDELIAWDPITLRREALPPLEDDGSAGPRYRLALPPSGSVFLVVGVGVGIGESAPLPSAEMVLGDSWELTLPGVPRIQLPAGPRPWTESGPRARAFAGVGEYATEVVLAADMVTEHRFVVSAADIGDLARVRVNGVDCGVLWTAPWQLDITDAVRAGRNTVVFEVANAWMNRLIAEAGSPTGEIFAPVAAVYAPDAPIQSSGLTGPVVITVIPKD